MAQVVLDRPRILPSLASLYPQLCRSTWLEIRNWNFAASPARATIR